MRLILVGLVACIVGTTVGVGALFLTETVSAADLLGFIPVMFVAAALMCGLFYLPGMLWLKRSQRTTKHSPLIVAFILNLPIFLFLLFALSIGRFFSGLGEILIFAMAFIVAGLVFGQGFLWYLRKNYL